MSIWQLLLGSPYKNKIFNRTEIRKYAKGYGFLSFTRKFGEKYGKKLMDTAVKTGIDVAKTASKRVIQKTWETTRDSIGNKIADKITLFCKPKEKNNDQSKENYNVKKEIRIKHQC